MVASIASIVDEHLHIWNSPPSEERTIAVARLYAPGVPVAEPEAAYSGHPGVEKAIDGLHLALPGMHLELTGPIQTAQKLSTYSWSMGPKGGDIVVTGRDVLTVEDVFITALYVLIDEPPQATGS
jgi:hypothetical protein